MFDGVPVRFWLLLLIAVVTWTPARYVYRHATRSPSRRDITKPAEDLSWRSSGALARNVAILAGLAAFAVFIFTSAAADFSRSPSFLPVLIIGFGVIVLWSVARSFASGTVEPLVRGASWKFTRVEHPKRYWASVVWNGLLSLFFVFFGGQLLIDAPLQALRDRCYDWKNEQSATAALAACDRLLDEHPDDDRSRVIAARGSALYRLGAFRRAGEDYTAALRLDPQDSSSHYNLGLVHERLGEREHATLDYGAAIATDPENADAFTNRGLIFLDTGKFDNAIADFTQAHRLQPDNIELLADRGVAYAWKKDLAHAEQDFAVVRKRDPSNTVLLHGEGLLAMNRGESARGARLFSAAIARDPRDAWAYEMRASAYQLLGDREKMQSDAATAQRLRDSANRR